VINSEYSKNSKDLKSCMMSWLRILLNGYDGYKVWDTVGYLKIVCH
jgi:hypothetical protein